MNRPLRFATLLLIGLAPSLAAATITNLSDWTLAEDPPNTAMSGMIDSPTQATLEAAGSVPSGTDIGFQSVDGPSVAASTGCYYFSPASDFSVAIDYNLSAVASSGGGGIGLGIGEDRAGVNSAGVGLAFINGLPTLLATAARIDNDDEPIASFGTPMGFGRFFVSYDSASGDITAGFSGTPGAATPDTTSVIAGIQDQWDDEPLLVSFFLRSQEFSLAPTLPSVPPLSGTSVTAVFSNFEVLSGTPVPVIPEPAAIVLALCGACVLGHARGW